MQRTLTLTRTLLFTAALLVVAVAANAGGINLAWNDCGAAGLAAKNFSCTTNTLSGAIMIASAIAPVPLDQFVGEESEMIIQTNQPTLSPWWGLSSQAGFNCRGTTAVATGFDFTGGPFTCVDPWSGAAAGGMNYVGAYDGPNRAQLRTVGAIPGNTSIDNSTEYYIFKVTLLGAKTTGTGSCAGCTDGACIVLKSIKLVEVAGAPAGDHLMTNAILNQYVTWQPGGATVVGGCPGAVPTHTRTWGSVKSLYR
jgi:hypothetical protein